MPPELVSLSEGPDILLDKPIMLLGRHHECDIQLNSRKVSRRHCCIAQVEDYLVVRDLQSTNGIRINGEKVIEGEIHPGDELTIGNFSYKIRWPGHPAQPAEESELLTSPSKAAMAKLVGTMEDESMESYEEPVALRESSFDFGPGIRKLEKPITGKEPVPNSSIERKGKMEDQPPSIILPENLDLRPFSDEASREKKEAKQEEPGEP